MTPLHRGGEEDPLNNRGLRNVTNLAGYVQAIREVAEYYGLPVLDLYATYGVQPAIPVMKDTYMPDGLHPNDAGHVLLTGKIAKFIESL